MAPAAAATAGEAQKEEVKARTDADFGDLAAVSEELRQVLVSGRPRQVLDEHRGAALRRGIVLAALGLLCCRRLCLQQSDTQFQALRATPGNL